jgi:hypothetical protein
MIDKSQIFGYGEGYDNYAKWRYERTIRRRVALGFTIAALALATMMIYEKIALS